MEFHIHNDSPIFDRIIRTKAEIDGKRIYAELEPTPAGTLSTTNTWHYYQFRYLCEFRRQNIKSCWLNYNRMCFYSISCISLFSFLIMQLRETNVYCEREYSLESLRLAKTNLTPAGKLSNRCSVIGISWLAHQKLELSDKRINTQR